MNYILSPIASAVADVNTRVSGQKPLQYVLPLNGVSQSVSIPTFTSSSGVLEYRGKIKRLSDGSGDTIFSGEHIQAQLNSSTFFHQFRFAYVDVTDANRILSFVTLTSSVVDKTVDVYVKVDTVNAKITATLNNVTEVMNIVPGQEIKSLSVRELGFDVSPITGANWFNGMLWDNYLKAPYTIQNRNVTVGDGVQVHGLFNKKTITGDFSIKGNMTWTGAGGYLLADTDSEIGNQRFIIRNDGALFGLGFTGVQYVLDYLTVGNHYEWEVIRKAGDVSFMLNGTVVATVLSVGQVEFTLNSAYRPFGGGTSVPYWNGAISNIQIEDRTKAKRGGVELLTPEVLESPLSNHSAWTYLGNGRWHLQGDGTLQALSFLLSTENPDYTLVSFEIESISGVGTGTPGLLTSNDGSSGAFNTVGKHTVVVSNAAHGSLIFKRSNPDTTMECVIKNISYKPVVEFDTDFWKMDETGSVMKNSAREDGPNAYNFSNVSSVAGPSRVKANATGWDFDGTGFTGDMSQRSYLTLPTIVGKIYKLKFKTNIYASGAGAFIRDQPNGTGTILLQQINNIGDPNGLEFTFQATTSDMSLLVDSNLDEAIYSVTDVEFRETSDILMANKNEADVTSGGNNQFMPTVDRLYKLNEKTGDVAKDSKGVDGDELWVDFAAGPVNDWISNGDGTYDHPDVPSGSGLLINTSTNNPGVISTGDYLKVSCEVYDFINGLLAYRVGGVTKQINPIDTGNGTFEAVLQSDIDNPAIRVLGGQNIDGNAQFSVRNITYKKTNSGIYNNTQDSDRETI